ncbi:MAG: apolipoprotein N-acyltransferase [Thermoguttaceae bacterium]
MSFLGALLLWLSFPPMDVWPLAWFAPIPWVWLIRRSTLDGRRPYRVLWLAGFAFWLGALHWLRLPHPATSLGWIALSFYFAFYLPLFVGLSRVAVHRLRVPVVLAAPVVWTGLELARAHLLTGMTMGSLGHTQYRWTMLIQLSDWAGAYGVSFLVMLVAASLARMLPDENRRWSFWPPLVAAVAMAAALGYGHMQLHGDAGRPGPRVALIQGSIDVEMRYDPGMRERIFREYYDLSREAVQKHRPIDLVVWPESMFLDSLIVYTPDVQKPREFPGAEAEFQQWLPKAVRQTQESMAALARSLDAPLLLGVEANTFDRQGMRCFNTAAFVSRDGQLLDRYDKMHLVMFGEYVPGAQWFPWLQRLTPLPVSAMPGRRAAAFHLGDVRIAPNICYETVLPHVIRRQVNQLIADGCEPDLLINLTNDGWFWGSSELDMHLACGVFRAVECRKPLLIAANTGFSAWIDADGRIRAQGPRRARQVLMAEPKIDHRPSWYLAHGDWFAGVCLAACVVCAVVGFRRKSGC